MKRSFLIIFSVITLSSGCVKMGSDYRRPDPGLRIPGSYQHLPEEAGHIASGDRWWNIFGDPELNEVVEIALENNWEIKTAAARVLEVRSQLVQTRADRLPGINVQGQAQKQRQTIRSTFPVRREFRDTVNAYNLSLPASFELDLWGRLARAEEGVRADLFRAEETRHTVAQTVVAETISLYLKIEALERQIQVAELRTETLADNGVRS